MRVPVGVVACVAAVLAAVPTGAQTSRRQVYATVLDDQGGPVRGLQAGDLVLRDGGVRQGVIDAGPATDPLEVAIVVDGFSPAELPVLRTALEAAVTTLRAENPSTQIGLVGAGPAARMISSPEGLATLDEVVATPAASNFVDAVIDGCSVLATAPDDRRVVLGLVKTHGRADLARPDRLAATVSALHVSLWTVELGASGPAEWSPAVDAALTDAARLGGSLRRGVKSPAEIGPAVHAVVDFLTAQYVVTYGWPDPMLSEFNLVTRHEAGKVLTPAWSR